MLKTKELIESMDNQYAPMLKQVNIPNFTKCIAQFSGLAIKEVSDGVIKEYLMTWARNKYPFFEMLNNKLQRDIPFDFQVYENDKLQDYNLLAKEYPAYALWLRACRNQKKNKISFSDFDWETRDALNSLDMATEVSDMLITRFFKSRLNAPDDLVTAIGRIYENDTIHGFFTISIDPVDMMTASENPYNWKSCYRLAVPNDSSHADGCLGAILDDTSLITYLWEKEGDMKLYDTYQLTDVRWKKIRTWIAIEPHSFAALHFNLSYPGKWDYPKEFVKTMRVAVEDWIWETKFKDGGYTNTWGRSWGNENIPSNCQRIECDRCSHTIGYGEYSADRVYVLTSYDKKIYDWYVYNEELLCPCGCGDTIPGADTGEADYYEDYYHYDGMGFCAENFSLENDSEEEEEEGYWCSCIDDYCTCGDCTEEECSECHYWQENHPNCSLNENEECDNEDIPIEYDDDSDRYVRQCDPDHCSQCPFYQLHHTNIEN